MKSFDIVEFGSALKEISRPSPSPAGTEVLLRVRASGVCHTDLHLQDGYYDLGRGRRLDMGDRGVVLPLTPGHEIVGEVIACGPQVQGLGIGETRLIYPWLGCGACPVCVAGEENLCLAPGIIGIHRAGGYSDHVVVPHPRCLLDIGELTPVEAAPYACSGLTAYSALKKIGASLSRGPLLIIGMGGLGLMCLMLLRALDGSSGAVVVDLDPKKLETAKAAGALAAIDGAAPDARDQIAAAVGGRLWSAIDFVGSQATAQLAFDSLTKGGKLVVVGLFGGEIALPLPLIATRSLAVQGSYVGSLPELAEVLALAQSGRAPKMPIVERPLHEAQAALDDLKANCVVGRTILRPDCGSDDAPTSAKVQTTSTGVR